MAASQRKRKGTPRPNAGRPPGRKNKATLEKELRAKEAHERITNEQPATGVQSVALPLDVLVEATRFFHAKYLDPKLKDEQPQHIKDAATYASMAAPYLHPKLSSVEMKADIRYDELSDADLDTERERLLARIEAAANAAGSGEITTH